MRDILLDTGCSRINPSAPRVSVREQAQPGEAVAIRCTHGNTVLYPLADVMVKVEGKQFAVEAAVSKTLPMHVH